MQVFLFGPLPLSLHENPEQHCPGASQKDPRLVQTSPTVGGFVRALDGVPEGLLDGASVGRMHPQNGAGGSVSAGVGASDGCWLGRNDTLGDTDGVSVCVSDGEDVPSASHTLLFLTHVNPRQHGFLLLHA